jgi:hypothetical protein
MTRRWVWVLVVLNLVALIALVFVYPQFMVSPGAVVEGHAKIGTDCFACHAPLRGASSERCVACHKLADVGLRSTTGQPILHATIKASFHQDLAEQNCMACHSDHAGPKLTQRSRKPFSHAMLRTEVREQCDSCHKPPANNLHRRAKGNCSQCHSTKAWKPATFDHDKSFVLDKDHNVDCATCHVNNDYNRYTCYGCHEHTVDNILRKHRKERISNINNCVRCHRSADGEGDEEGEDD